jgi:hypothetical protein
LAAAELTSQTIAIIHFLFMSLSIVIRKFSADVC